MVLFNVRMGKECSQSDFDHGRVVGARSPGMFTSLEFPQNDVKNPKEIPMSSSCVGGKTFLIREIRAGRADRCELTGRLL